MDGWKSHVYVLARPAAAATRGFKMVLFTQPSKQFVGGTCAPPSAVLVLFTCVLYFFPVLSVNSRQTDHSVYTDERD